MFTIQLAILGAYVLLLYAVAFYAERLGRGGVVGYFLANRGLPPLVVAVAPAVTQAGLPAANPASVSAVQG